METYPHFRLKDSSRQLQWEPPDSRQSSRELHETFDETESELSGPTRYSTILRLPTVHRNKFVSVVEKVTSFNSSGIMLPKDSLYGSAIVLPQVARSLGYNSFYVGKACMAWFSLVVVLVLQSMFVYQVYRMVELKDLEQGFTKGGWSYIGTPRWRWYLCNTDENANDDLLRKLCVVAFTIVLFKDLRQTFEMAAFIWKVPNEAGNWMVVSLINGDQIQVNTNGRKEVVRKEEAQMQWQVDALEIPWKVLAVFGALIPKACLFWSLLFYGAMWLMNTTEPGELILNCVANVFVLELDEAVFAAVTTADVQQYMDNLLPWMPPIDQDDEETDTESTAERTRDSWYYLRSVTSLLSFPVLLPIIVFTLFHYYYRNCGAHGSKPE